MTRSDDFYTPPNYRVENGHELRIKFVTSHIYIEISRRGNQSGECYQDCCGRGGSAINLDRGVIREAARRLVQSDPFRDSRYPRVKRFGL